jgi:hypothetical protein
MRFDLIRSFDIQLCRGGRPLSGLLLDGNHFSICDDFAGHNHHCVALLHRCSPDMDVIFVLQLDRFEACGRALSNLLAADSRNGVTLFLMTRSWFAAPAGF